MLLWHSTLNRTSSRSEPRQVCGECCGSEVPELAAAAWPLVDEYVLSEATRSLLKLLADTDALLAALPPPPPQVHGARVGLGLPTSP